MDIENKIVEILKSWEKDNGYFFNSILEDDYENIAHEIVKLFAITYVSGSLPDDVPLFVDWLDKYYTHAGNDDLYKRKDNGKIEPQRKLYNDYKRAYKLGNDC